MLAEQLAQIPYVGPRPLRVGEPIYGREDEIDELFRLIQARRVVVLHAPSGAGKSSLACAGLLPRMKHAGFDMWRPIHLNPKIGEIEGSPEGANPYLLSAMLSLEAELPSSRRRSPAELAQLSLRAYVQTRPRRKRRLGQEIGLIFDNLDVLLGGGWTPRSKRQELYEREFFHAMGEVLTREACWALLVVRDESLARLTRHQDVLPTRLANTFHLNGLSLEGAEQVITRLDPQLLGDTAAARELVEALTLSEVESHDGRVGHERTSTVEPLLLQTVCRSLWCSRMNGARPAQPHAAWSGVGDVLEDYCAGAIARISADSVETERDLRKRLARALLANGRRTPLRLGSEAARALSPSEREVLLTYNIVECREWAGTAWLELSHDRLAAALLGDNERWARAHPVVLEQLERVLSGRAPLARHVQPPRSALPPRTTPSIAQELERSQSWSDTTGEWELSELDTLVAEGEGPPVRAGQERLAQPLIDEVWTAQLEAWGDGPCAIALRLALANLSASGEPWYELALVASDRGLQQRDLVHLLESLAPDLEYTNLERERWPTSWELARALLELGHALGAARGAPKRQLLCDGFCASLLSTYFVSGQGSPLWALARELEHQDYVRLVAMVAGGPEHDELDIQELFACERLSRLGLLVRHGPEGTTKLTATGTALVRFLSVGHIALSNTRSRS